MLKRSIFSKIFVLTVGVSFIVGICILLLDLKERTRVIKESLIQNNILLAKMISKNIESGYYTRVLPLETLKFINASEDIVFLWIVKPNGEIYLAEEPKMLGRIIKDSSLGTEEIVIKNSISPITGEKIKLIVYPIQIKKKGEKPWNLFLGISFKSIIASQKKIFIQILYSLFLIIIFIVFVSFYLAKKIINPLEQLRKGAEIIGKGNFDYRIDIKTGDEIGELAKSFNQMAEKLKESYAELEESKDVLEVKVKARTKELEELTESLDEQVKERTRELQEKVKELERFNKLAVGRELKMIELKKEIERLKSIKYG